MVGVFFAIEDTVTLWDGDTVVTINTGECFKADGEVDELLPWITDAWRTDENCDRGVWETFRWTEECKDDSNVERNGELMDKSVVKLPTSMLGFDGEMWIEVKDVWL